MAQDDNRDRIAAYCAADICQTASWNGVPRGLSEMLCELRFFCENRRRARIRYPYFTSMGQNRDRISLSGLGAVVARTPGGREVASSSLVAPTR